jgi:hypothetical protein
MDLQALVLPLPQNGSSTIFERLDASLMASAIKATGLTVGCIASSSRRPARKVFTPAYWTSCRVVSSLQLMSRAAGVKLKCARTLAP